jgi:rhomboid family protein
MAWIYFGATVLAGVGAYWLRNNHRAMYGLSEIAVGLLLMYLAWFPHSYALLYSEPGAIDKLLTMPVQIFAGIYAFVRGCDNFLSGVRDTT